MHEHEIRDWLDGRAGRASALLADLIRAGRPAAGDEPSVDEAVELTLQAARELGFEAEVCEADRSRLSSHPAFLGSPDGTPVRYLVARRPGRGGGRSLVLNGHLDVVAAGAAEQWDRDPWGGEAVDGNLVGRGASDAKGPFVSALLGAACAAEVSGGLLGDLTVVAATDEEVGGMSTLASLLDGVTADGVLVGEPTDLGLAPACRGFSTFRLTVVGRHAHAGAGFEGVNAIVKMALCVTALDRLQHELDERFPSELYAQLPVGHLVNIGTIKAGEWTRSVPDLCTVDGSVGVIGTDDTAAVRAAVEEAIARVAAADPWLSEHPPVLEWQGFALEPAFTPSDHPLVELAAGVLRRVTGREPAVLPLFGASDLRFYTRYFGIPGTHVGAGSMRRGHGPNEFVEVADVVTGAEAVAAIALGWAGCACPACAAGGSAA